MINQMVGVYGKLERGDPSLEASVTIQGDRGVASRYLERQERGNISKKEPAKLDLGYKKTEDDSRFHTSHLNEKTIGHTFSGGNEKGILRSGYVNI